MQIILTAETCSYEDFTSPVVLGKEALLAVAVQLLRPDDVVDLCKLLGNPSQAGVLSYDGVNQGSCNETKAIKYLKRNSFYYYYFQSFKKKMFVSL